MLMRSLLMRSLLLATVASSVNAWSYSDGPGRSWTGTGNRPTIICHIDICDSLWSMGVRADQMKGYFGGDANSWSALCHGTHCMSAHFEQMERVNQPGSTYAIDMAKVNEIAPNIIVDAAYCHQGRYTDECMTNSTYKGLLQYASGELADLQAGAWSMINIDVAGRGYIEVVDALQRFAIAIGDAPNPDTVQHCNNFHAAMTAMHNRARVMWAEGIRVTTISIGRGATTIYAAQPTDDPILIMLQELGVMMVHVNVNDPRRGYWEYIGFNNSRPQGQVTALRGGGSIYPTDVFLYDARSHQSVTEDFNAGAAAQFNHPAWIAGQIAPWPIDSTWTYERGTRILKALLDVFNNAQRIMPRGTCTLYDATTNARLPPGEFGCFVPGSGSFPSCPAAGSSPSMRQQVEDAVRGMMADDVVVGISIGLFIAGLLVGILLTAVICKCCCQKRTATANVTKSVTAGVEVQQVKGLESGI